MQVTEIRREDIVKELSELEERYHMPTSDFVYAFANGRLHETPDFLHWAHLSAVLGLFDRKVARV